MKKKKRRREDRHAIFLEDRENEGKKTIIGDKSPFIHSYAQHHEEKNMLTL
jgi:hypothetical protein